MLFLLKDRSAQSVVRGNRGAGRGSSIEIHRYRRHLRPWSWVRVVGHRSGCIVCDRHDPPERVAAVRIRRRVSVHIDAGKLHTPIAVPRCRGLKGCHSAAAGRAGDAGGECVAATAAPVVGVGRRPTVHIRCHIDQPSIEILICGGLIVGSGDAGC